MTIRRRWMVRLLGLTLVAHVMLAAPAAAQPTPADVVATLAGVQNAMIEATIETRRAQNDAALLAIDDALATLDGLRGTLADPGLAAQLGRSARKLGRKIRATEKKASKARAAITAGKRARVQLRKLRSASKRALAAARTVGRPVLAEVNPRAAGFHHPDDEVQLQVYAADGTPCAEPPVLEVLNDSFGTSVDLASVSVTESEGLVSLRMGPDEGGVRVTVTACGASATVLLYNYGPKPPKGLPRDFPLNLPLGDYQMTFSGEIAGVVVPPTTVGVFTMVDILSFADQIVEGFRQAARAASAVPGCRLRVAISPFDGSGFSISIRLRCRVGGYRASGDLHFRIERI